MIINKALTEKEREQVKSLTSFAEIEEIYFRANRRYILSFSKDINMTYTREGVPDDLAPILKLSDSDSEKVRQAILSDVHEILNAITKEEIEEEIRHNDWYFVPDTELKEKLKTPCWGTCWGKLQEILKLQMTAYDYYRLDNLELIELFQKKAAKWYEPPTPPDSKDSKKKETDSGELEELPIIQRVKKPESVC